MADWDAPITEWAEYAAGRDWAEEHQIGIAGGRALSADELRTMLFREAATVYPSQRDSMDNDLRQTAWVAGAYRHLVDTLPLTPGGLAATFDIGLEMSVAVGAELASRAALEELKRRPASWWRRKFGDATPNQIVDLLAMRFRRQERRSPSSKWETLIQTMGSREMQALASLKSVTLNSEAEYWTFDVDGEDGDFVIMARPVVHEGRVIEGAGEIVG